MFYLSSHVVNRLILWNLYLLKLRKRIVTQDTLSVHAYLDKDVLKAAESQRKCDPMGFKEAEKSGVVFLLIVGKQKSH